MQICLSVQSTDSQLSGCTLSLAMLELRSEGQRHQDNIKSVSSVSSILPCTRPTTNTHGNTDLNIKDLIGKEQQRRGSQEADDC